MFDAGLGQIDACDLETSTCEEDCIPSLPFSQAKYGPSGEALSVFPQEFVGFSAVVVALGLKAPLPDVLRVVRIGSSVLLHTPGCGAW